MTTDLNNQNLKYDTDTTTVSPPLPDMPHEVSKTTVKLEGGPGHQSYYKDTLCDPLLATVLESKEPEPSILKKVQSRIKDFVTQFRKQPVKKNGTKHVAKNTTLSKTNSKAAEKQIINDTADALNGVLSEAKESAQKEYEQTKDGTTKALIGLMDSLDTELKKENLNWKQIEFLVRQIAVLLTHKMASNEGKTIEQQQELMRQDIANVKKSYEGKWELFLGIASGGLSIVGGCVGIGGGFAKLGGASKASFKLLQTLSQGCGTVGQGVQPFSSIARNYNEKERAVFNFELEWDRNNKGTAESSLQNDRSSRSGQMSQINSAIEAAFRAFSDMARG